jgi:orotate phosphoribosyltransferase
VTTPLPWDYMRANENMLLDELRDVLRNHCLTVGPCKLASGQQSNVYIDCKRLLTARRCRLAAMCLMVLAGRLSLGFDALGGPGIGGAILTGACLAECSLTGTGHIRGFVVRPKEKDHGRPGRVAGQLKGGDRVTLLDDVLTTGGSLKDAADEVRLLGATVQGALVLVDRRQQGKCLDLGFSAHGVFSLADLVGDLS